MSRQHHDPETLVRPRGYTHAVAVRGGTTVHVSGQVAFDAQGRVVGEGDLRAQTEQVFANLHVALAAAGAGWQHLVKTTVFVVGLSPAARDIVAEVRARHLAGVTPPASTMVGVTALVRPELLIEIEAVAVIDA